VKAHVKAILRKIRVQNRTQAAIWGKDNESLTRMANPLPQPARADSQLQTPMGLSAGIERPTRPTGCKPH